MLKALFLVLILFSASSASANLFTSHDDLVHDLAHYGAGTIVAEGVHLLLRKSDLTPWQKFTVEVMAALAANAAYELVTQKPFDVAVERTAFGTAGGISLGFVVNYNWGKGWKRAAPGAARPRRESGQKIS